MDGAMAAKFLRAHAHYLMTGEVQWPYVNSAGAIASAARDAADILDSSGVVARDEYIDRLETALLGIVGRWEQNNGQIEHEFIRRATGVLAKPVSRRPWEPQKS